MSNNIGWLAKYPTIIDMPNNITQWTSYLTIQVQSMYSTTMSRKLVDRLIIKDKVDHCQKKVLLKVLVYRPTSVSQLTRDYQLKQC